ncbi:MAG: transketolase family protein [Hungatella sp.]|jgi:transketolase|nr:transketolase family protein [Hungatella sp.]
MTLERENIALKEVYSDLLVEYGAKDPRIVIVEADLMRSGSTDKFQKVFPERTFDVGIAESNMMCVAAGLSLMGKIPFTHTFAVFASRRCCDQVNQSVAYAGCNVKMCGSDPGITTELNGGTHMSMDDIGIMRGIPTMTVFEPVDSCQLRALFPQILALDTPVYIRLFRPNTYKIFSEKDRDFKLGKGVVLKKGTDVTIIASGIMVAEALKAAEELSGEGIDAEVINIHTIKPLDTELILASAAKTGCVVTAENGSIYNGLGSAVAEVLSEHLPCPLKRMGVQDHFGQIGHVEELLDAFHMSCRDIAEAGRGLAQRRLH